MCGRYNFSDEKSERIKEIIREVSDKLYRPIKTGEVFPTDYVPVLLPDNRAEAMIWGFPHFKGSGVIINARCETVTEKRMFRDSVLSRRCVIPSTGFYEWKREGGRKTKYLFRVPGASELYMAGFYNRIKDKDGVEKDRFVILTTAANDSMRELHDRMPVVLHGDECKGWLSDSASFERYFDRSGMALCVAV